MSASDQTLEVQIPEKLVWVFEGNSRYRGAYGGRGSAKTRSFATMAAIRGGILAAAGKRGIILCGREYMNSLDESSMAEVKEAILSNPWLEQQYDVGEKVIRTKDKRIEFKFAGLRQNIDSIKSKARIHILWVDEAEPVSEEAWRKIVPTVREQDSEIWVTWNPERKTSATHQRFRVTPPDNARIVALNWRDNPWFPEVLEMERREDFAKRPEQYGHVWEGEFATVHDGAYFAHLLTQARAEGRVSHVAADPLLEQRAYWDIGGTGQRADARAIWIVQFVGKEIRVIDYRETVGQPLSADVTWMRENGYGKIHCVLPHDGETNDRVHDVSYESFLRTAGHGVTVIPNQGRGAANKRIEAVRRILPACWFDLKTEAGLDALGWYHEKRDDERNIGLGPHHDWSSHGADAFGLMAVAYEAHSAPRATPIPFKRRAVI